MSSRRLKGDSLWRCKCSSEPLSSMSLTIMRPCVLSVHPHNYRVALDPDPNPRGDSGGETGEADERHPPPPSRPLPKPCTVINKMGRGRLSGAMTQTEACTLTAGLSVRTSVSLRGGMCRASTREAHRSVCL